MHSAWFALFAPRAAGRGQQAPTPEWAAHWNDVPPSADTFDDEPKV